jgi:hypothetical protein
MEPKTLLAAALAAMALWARTSVADAPTGHYTIGTGAAAGTVYDTKAHLTWQRTVPSGPYTMSAAVAYCASLDLNGKGWRMPTAKELFSLVDHSVAAGTMIDSSAFPTTPYEIYWSTSVYQTNAAWVVDFTSGYIELQDSQTEWLRCVRTGP